MNIITLCPTKNRPKQFKEMSESFFATSNSKNMLVAILDPTDKDNEEYIKTMDSRVSYFYTTGTITECLNKSLSIFNNFKYYHITNDDVIYRTKNWDDKFIEILTLNKGGIAYGNDLFQGENLPTFPFISSSIVHATGWLQMPTLNRYCGDVVWRFLGNKCKCLYYLNDVIIKHNWSGCSDPEINRIDTEAFVNWLPMSHILIERVKNELH